ncbi:hypothetical protein EVA_14638 [gut metagenome]|uniref:Uncharacterized protein n=1 Tax=gut metagenome TaxID=749906 RepID=J9FQN0_9ZZZZ
MVPLYFPFALLSARLIIRLSLLLARIRLQEFTLFRCSFYIKLTFLREEKCFNGYNPRLIDIFSYSRVHALNPDISLTCDATACFRSQPYHRSDLRS